MKREPVWESLALLAAIASLWPCYILQWPGPFWRLLPYAIIALLVFIMVRRWRRLKDTTEP